MEPIVGPSRAVGRGRALRAALVICAAWMTGCQGPRTLDALRTSYAVAVTREAYEDPTGVAVPAGVHVWVTFRAGDGASAADVEAILEDATVTLDGLPLDRYPLREPGDPSATQFTRNIATPAPIDPNGYTIVTERPGESMEITVTPVVGATIERPTDGALVPRSAPLAVKWSAAASAPEVDQVVVMTANGDFFDPDLQGVTETTIDPASLATAAGEGTGEMASVLFLVRSRSEDVEGGSLAIVEMLDSVPLTLTP